MLLSRKLITTLYEAEKADVIDNLHKIMTSSSTMPPQELITQQPKLAWYNSYVKGRHSQLDITVVSDRWLPSPTRKIFKLAIVKKERTQFGALDEEFVHMMLWGQVDRILLQSSPIELEKLFMNAKGERKVILIDGAPGSGKSTLSVLICQKWRRGELFQEFSIVILVQLRDPAVQSAQSIANLIPCPDIESARKVADEIKANFGKGVLWVLDGWDELPSHLREESLLRDMIIPPRHSPITQSSVVVTSRPISSGELSELVSSRVEVLGFTWEEQKQYFTECLKGDTKAVASLIESLSRNPAVKSSCYLPLNASIVAHLYLSNGCLPNTVYGVFSSLVQHILSRYLHERQGKAEQEARVTSLDLNSLPQELQSPFDQLCRLAFTGILQNKVTFSQSDLDAFKDSTVICEIGLLQATPSILSEGRTVYYNFIHLSIQEMLSALHISHMPASEQISKLDALFDESRFSSVFQFYSAITKLRISVPFLRRISYWFIPVGRPYHMRDLVKKIIKRKNKTLIVSLLRCLYEAQDPSLCEFVARQLENKLDLKNVLLTPVDCLAIGYFLSSISLLSFSLQQAGSDATRFDVNLTNCSLGDAAITSLMQSICVSMDGNSMVNIQLYMSLGANRIGKEGALHIAEVLKSTSVVSELLLPHNNPIGDEGLRAIFDALKQNETLKYLDVSYCDMSDAGVASLADALKSNNMLEKLHINGNRAVTENGMTSLIEVLSRSSGLLELWIPSFFEFYRVRNEIQEARMRNGLPRINVWGLNLHSHTHWPLMYGAGLPSLPLSGMYWSPSDSDH